MLYKPKDSVFSPLTSHMYFKEIKGKVVTCESWDLTKKAGTKELMPSGIVELEETLESPLDSKEIEPVSLKGNQP